MLHTSFLLLRSMPASVRVEQMSSTKKNIAIYGAGWVHNIGNAFIQIGSKYSVEKALPGANVHIIDGNPFTLPTPLHMRALSKIGRLPGLSMLQKHEQSYCDHAHSMQVKLTDIADLDAVILSGVWLTVKYLQHHLDDFLMLKERGIPLILNGGGGTYYHQQEFNEVAKILKQIQPLALISRDQRVCDAYTGVLDHVYSGIDAGFFVGESFSDPLPMAEKPTVFCFDRSAIPKEVTVTQYTIVTHHAQVGLRYNTFDKGRLFVSEMAEDYLNLYANCDAVYSDRVHACVAALAFGNKARLIDKTPRAYLFERVGCGNVRQETVRLSPELLEQRKAEHIAHLQKVLADLA